MRRFSTIFLLIFVFLILLTVPANSAYRGGINYSIPIEYKNLSESDLKIKAEKYFNSSSEVKDGIISDDTSNALVLYSVLMHKNPNEVMYPVRLGILYDKINKDRYAKSSFSQAIGIDSSRYEPYFYYGEFYYKRQMYRKALRYYNRALECKNVSAETLNVRIADVNKKLGINNTETKTKTTESISGSDKVIRNSDNSKNESEYSDPYPQNFKDEFDYNNGQQWQEPYSEFDYNDAQQWQEPYSEIDSDYYDEFAY